MWNLSGTTVAHQSAHQCSHLPRRRTIQSNSAFKGSSFMRLSGDCEASQWSMEADLGGYKQVFLASRIRTNVSSHFWHTDMSKSCSDFVVMFEFLQGVLYYVTGQVIWKTSNLLTFLLKGARCKTFYLKHSKNKHKAQRNNSLKWCKTCSWVRLPANH